MTFIARLLKYLFWFVVVSWSVSILRRIVGKMGEGAPGGTKPYTDVPNDAVNQKLVRDPICGMHIAEGLALPLRQGGQIVHFCSAACRDRYLNGTQQISASA